MSGFEHQVAAHMMAEGLDHYARAMSSYGTFINACGYQYHGPKGLVMEQGQLLNMNLTAS